ncbi:CASH domain-dontaining protein [Methanophagales archaeon]|nr:CASH domain-dontaining protein [Methanophagales archaeon]
MGTVISKDMENNMITIQADSIYNGIGPGWSPCNCTLEGVPPNENALNGLNVGDYVEAHSLGTPGGKWITLARIISSAENFKVITDIYGDPASTWFCSYPEGGKHYPPLLGDYMLTYVNTPNCSRCYGCNCEAEYTTVNITNDGDVSTSLYPNQSYVHQGETYHIDITFHSGEAPANPECTAEFCCGPQPISDFTIHMTVIAKVHNLNTGEDFVTIQAAIDDPETLSGHAINVDPGTYLANIIVNKSLTINSTSGNPADTVVLASNPDADVFCVTVDSVNISGFTVQGADELLSAGIHLNSTNNCIISNTNVSNNFYGFLLQNSSNNSIYHNEIANNSNPAYDDTGTNAWNCSYPSGGNYWGDYTEEYKTEYDGDPEDKSCGANQDQVCDGDGIWDKPYKWISGDGNATDKYPLESRYCSISDIDNDPEFYEGQKVLIDGEYMGWNCSGVSGPGITRSDWCVRDGTGIIYVTGKSSGLDYPDDVGERVFVTGFVRVTESEIAYIEATNVERYNSVSNYHDTKSFRSCVISDQDLAIMDIWRAGSTIYYKVKNQGTANVGSSYTSLTVEGVFKASDYVASLEQGAERIESFTYNWTYTPPGDNITICADYQNTVTEFNETNNCRSKTLLYPPPTSGAGVTREEVCHISEQIGFSTGGAKDVNNFRENIGNDYLPLPTDITYEGLFYDYYFDTGEKAECQELFCPSYSYALSKDPVSEVLGYYLSVGLNSGINESDFQRKKLNLVLILDISGSMGSSFDEYYYDRFGNRVDVNETEDAEKSKIEIAAEAIVALLDHLEDDDRFGLVLFNTGAELAEPVSLVGDKDMPKLKGDVLEISATGGTQLSAGMQMATELYDEFLELNQSEYENRIIFLTDAMPNLGQTSESSLLGMTETNANKKVYTTFIGIGVDFNTELVEYITKIRGANYYSVHSAKQFKERMDDEFEYMVTPLVFDLQLNLDAVGYEIEKVYGSPEADEATGEIMKVKTLFPSKKEGGETRGGLVLLKLRKISPETSLKLNVSYEDRNGVSGSDVATIVLEEKEPDFFDNSGIRKGILLSRYADLIKNWIHDERASIERNETVKPAVNVVEGILPPVELGRWERQSIPLRVSEPYKALFSAFSSYFEAEMNAIGDDTLGQELDILDMLSGYE